MSCTEPAHTTFAIASHSSSAGQEEEIKQLLLWKPILFIAGGLAGLIFGGQWFVEGASNIARDLGVSESIIGLTLVARGTSLRELATSFVAALKKNHNLFRSTAGGASVNRCWI